MHPTLESERNCKQKHHHLQTKPKKQKIYTPLKYLLKLRQRGIGGHGGAECGNVSELVAGETVKRKPPISSQS